ncbi:MAG: sigma-70 factor domain-containing protein, partial [Smithellaceae bacterium]|nr:sigma-70 factor domain-containing protein [Smithellaceae bacterium]
MQLPAVTGTLDTYINEISRFPILTAEEEFALAVSLKKNDAIEAAE